MSRRGENSGRYGPMYIAIMQGKLGEVKTLVEEKKADVNLVDHKRRPHLQNAAFQGCDEIVEYLLEQKAGATATDTLGRTALQLAAFSGSADMIRQLINAGSEINHQDNKQTTPLMACFRGLLESKKPNNTPQRAEAVAAALIENKANVNLTDYKGRTARTFAEKYLKTTSKSPHQLFPSLFPEQKSATLETITEEPASRPIAS